MPAAFRLADRAARRARAAAMTLVGAALCACVTSIGPLADASGDRDPGPFPDAYEQIVARWIQDEFRFYARVEGLQISRPEPGFARAPRLIPRRTRYGWWSSVRFRAVDRIGAPTGTLHHAVLLRDGQVVAQQKLVF